MDVMITSVVGSLGLTGLIALTFWATFFSAIMPVLLLIALVDGPTGGRFWKDDIEGRQAARRARSKAA